MHLNQAAQHILVTGANRSGTTWVGRTVSLHSQVRYIHEPFNVSYPNSEMGLKLERWFTYAPASSQKEIIQVSFNRLLNGDPFHVALQACQRAGLDVKTPFRFGKYFLQQIVSPQRLLIKDPIALLSVGWLYEQLGFKVICMIRNPLAFVGSMKKAGWRFHFKDFMAQETLMKTKLAPFYDEVAAFCQNPGDIVDQATLLWNLLHFTILDYQKTYPSWLFVKYESLASDPLLGFQSIFDYLGLTMDDSIQETIEAFTSEENPVEARTNRYQPRYAKASLTTWQDRLTAEEANRIIRQTRDIAEQFYNDFDNTESGDGHRLIQK